MVDGRFVWLLACFGACTSTPAAGPSGLPELRRMTFPHQSIRAVDVLFVIDDGPGMGAPQAILASELGAFTDALAARPAGLPDLHVAVVSSDLGAGSADVPGCAPGGDRGVFRIPFVETCPGAGLPSGERFLSNAGGVANQAASRSLADWIACTVGAGEAGCAFPQPLASALRALGADGAPPPPENAGFLRPNAFLAVVVLANEDDCSAPADSALFDPQSRYVDDPLGPLTAFRCSEYGVSCGGSPPSRTAAGSLMGCQSAEDGRLLRVADVVSKLKALKADPHMVLAAAITGPPTPFTVELGPPGLADDPHPWPALAPACLSIDGGVRARPGVRLEQWVYTFGHNGTLEDICAGSPASLQRIAETIGGVLGPACLTGRFARVVGPHGARPDCTITDYPSDGAGGSVPTPLPSCVDSAGTAPCWTLTDDAACPGGKLLAFQTPPGQRAVGDASSVQCLVCDDATDRRCL